MIEKEPFSIRIDQEREVVRLFPHTWPLLEKVKAVYGIIMGDILTLEKDK